jgi:hypothetical protein
MSNIRIEFDWEKISKEECEATVTICEWGNLSIIQTPRKTNKLKVKVEPGLLQLSPANGEKTFLSLRESEREMIGAIARTYLSALNGEKQIFEWIEMKEYNRNVDFSEINISIDEGITEEED